MDPKQNAQLDPKLQEAYNRVMGTPTPPIATPTGVTPPPVTPMPQPADALASTPQPTTSPATLPTPELTKPPAVLSTPTPSVNPSVTPASTLASPTPPLASTPVVVPHSVETVRVGGNTPAATNTQANGTVAKEKKNGISPVIIVVGAIVFLLVYTLFWVKFLNVPLPFLNQ